jgi:hypothetical protein
LRVSKNQLFPQEQLDIAFILPKSTEKLAFLLVVEIAHIALCQFQLFRGDSPNLAVVADRKSLCSVYIQHELHDIRPQRSPFLQFVEVLAFRPLHAKRLVECLDVIANPRAQPFLEFPRKGRRHQLVKRYVAAEIPEESIPIVWDVVVDEGEFAAVGFSS